MPADLTPLQVGIFAFLGVLVVCVAVWAWFAPPDDVVDEAPTLDTRNHLDD